MIARCDPRFLGQPFSGWSLFKLRDYLIDTSRVTAISIETVRRILHETGRHLAGVQDVVSQQRRGKVRRSLDLYDHPPAGGRVLCADESGPLNQQPRPGKAWKPRSEPVRLRWKDTRPLEPLCRLQRQGPQGSVKSLRTAGRWFARTSTQTTSGGRHRKAVIAVRLVQQRAQFLRLLFG